MAGVELTRYDGNTWLIVGGSLDVPKRLITRATTRMGGTRYIVHTWALDPSHRQVVSIHHTLSDAARSIQ